MEKMQRLGSLGEHVGPNVRRLRTQQGLSLEQLSSRLAEVGTPMALNTLSKLERGVRGVDLDEVAALARALSVPPVVVIFPLGAEELVEVLPGREMGPWEAVKWFSGEGPFLVQMPDGYWATDDFEAWQESPVQAFRQYDELLASWNQARNLAHQAFLSEAGDEASQREVAFHNERRVQVEQLLRAHRRRMRRDGLEPGRLTENLAHIETDS